MSLTSDVARSGPYAGNNSTVTPYVAGFFFLADADLVVTVRTSAGAESTLLLTTDYVVTGAGAEAGGSLVTTVAVPTTSTVLIVRRTPATQTADYVEADEFPAASHERALDKLTMLHQENKDVTARAFRLRDSASAIAAIAPVVSSVLGLDASGLPIFRTSTELLSFINTVTTVFNMPTKTWLDAAARATTVPDFIGQVGMQRDTMTLYMGSAISAGSWASTTVGSVAPGAITTAMLAAGLLSADVNGRAKMAAAYLMATHLNVDAVTGQTAKTLFEDADRLLGWSSADAALRTFAGNVAVPPGSVIQTVEATPYTANTNILTVIPTDDTIPQVGEGTQILSLSITPLFADSKIRLAFHGTFSINATSHGSAALFRGAISNAIKSTCQVVSANNFINSLTIQHIDSPATTSAVTYTIRVGPGSVATMRMNGTVATRVHGGAQAATLVAQEIKV